MLTNKMIESREAHREPRRGRETLRRERKSEIEYFITIFRSLKRILKGKPKKKPVHHQ